MIDFHTLIATEREFKDKDLAITLIHGAEAELSEMIKRNPHFRRWTVSRTEKDLDTIKCGGLYELYKYLKSQFYDLGLTQMTIDFKAASDSQMHYSPAKIEFSVTART